MEMRPLGRNGPLVSRIGLGLAALGRPGYINLGHAQDLPQDHAIAAMEANAHAVLDAAWEGGVRYFDAARSYGRAEAFLASWLSARQVDAAAVVGSKWGYTYTANWQVKADKHEVKDHSLPVLVRQFGESHGLLGGHLRLYQIHSATLDSGVLDNRTVLEELARIRDQGVMIGLSLSGAHQAETLQKAAEIRVGGSRLFDVVQATWNLLEPSAGSALAEAHKFGMGIIVKEALANGRLTARNGDRAFPNKRMLLEDLATTVGVTVDALALAAVLAQPWADLVLSGAATVEQLSSNLAASQVKWHHDIANRLESIAETPDEYWNTRSKLPWN